MHTPAYCMLWLSGMSRHCLGTARCSCAYDPHAWHIYSFGLHGDRERQPDSSPPTTWGAGATWTVSSQCVGLHLGSAEATGMQSQVDGPQFAWVERCGHSQHARTQLLFAPTEAEGSENGSRHHEGQAKDQMQGS